MFKPLIVAAAAALAIPAAAQAPAAPPPPDPIEEAIVGSIPEPEQIEAMAPALDRMVGALLDVDVGPIMDATDPYRRHAGFGRRGRTLGALGSRDDPYFEQRLRSSIYRSSVDMARMTGAFAAAAPSLARSLREVQAAFGAAIDDYHRRAGDAPYRDRPYADGPDRDDRPYADEPDRDDGPYGDEPYPDAAYPDDRGD